MVFFFFVDIHVLDVWDDRERTWAVWAALLSSSFSFSHFPTPPPEDIGPSNMYFVLKSLLPLIVGFINKMLLLLSSVLLRTEKDI